ncbi:MAG: hypothetical protein E6G91_21540, partial [Alphaproteobacteria bacterium]
MTDDKELQRSGAEREQRLLTVCGYAAAAAFCAVSLSANLQYGLSLGHTLIDKATYTAASMAADVFKMAAPLLVLSLRRQRLHTLVIAGLVLWLGCVAWSMTSAVGFVLSTRGEVVAVHAAKTATRHGWEAKVERDETQLATLGRHRPSDVIKAELFSAAVPLHIWRRSRHCQDVSMEESRSVCAPVLGLRKELVAAEAAERLEAQLVAGRAELATASVVGSVADPQASGLARLARLDDATVRTGIALLLAGLIEAGSALGFTLVSVATGGNSQPATPPHHPPGLSDAARPSRPTRPLSNANSQNWRAAQTRHQGAAASHRGRGLCDGSCRLAASRDGPPRREPRSAVGSERAGNTDWPKVIERWVQIRLKIDAGDSIPAREAYGDFCRWARSAGIGPCTETR